MAHVDESFFHRAHAALVEHYADELLHMDQSRAVRDEAMIVAAALDAIVPAL